MSRVLDTLNADNALADWQNLAKAPAQTEWTLYPCKLVTPLYGGGVRAGEVDPDLPIRPSSIRGQLRFWWRIACGSDDSSENLFKREVAIWGGIAEAGPTASQVRVRVRGVGPLDLEPSHCYEPNPAQPGQLKSFPRLAHWAEGYALFSNQGKLTRDRRSIEEEPKALAKPGTGFELGVLVSASLTEDQRGEVLTALRWWASFGGIGARTRRGLGAVAIQGLLVVQADEVAKRGGVLALRLTPTGVTEAWKAAVGRLKEFRQKLNVGRNTPSSGTQSPAGRSFWPEADSIRSLSGCADARHATRLVAIDGFPRAAFGLPIVFHFKDAPSDRDRRKPGFDPRLFDPDDHVLEPADRSRDDKRDRLASPLILRPYWNGSKWVPAALLLPGWETHQGMALKFKSTGYTPEPWPKDPATRKGKAAGVRPLAGRADEPLTAFMKYFLEP
ncbi:MAG: type III-B CRISPR module RAMP protein Cmr1 [Chromatiaceae bacterium]